MAPHVPFPPPEPRRRGLRADPRLKGLFFVTLSGLLHLAGCRRPGPELPIGILRANSVAEIHLAAQAGFDSIQTDIADPEGLSQLMSMAQRAGIAETFVRPTADLSRIPGSIRASLVRSLSSPEMGQGATAASPALSPGPQDKMPPAWTSLPGRPGQPDMAIQVVGPVSVMGIDPMNPWGPGFVRPEGRELWTILETRPRSVEEGDSPHERASQASSIIELRYASYLLLLKGSRGLWFQAGFRPEEDWFPLSWVVRELASFKPVLTGGKPLPKEFLSAPSGMLVGAWRHRWRRYIVLLNTASAPLPLPTGLLSSRWRPLYELRRELNELTVVSHGRPCLRKHQVLVLEERLPF